MDAEKNELVVSGYRFATLADAQEARIEEQKIENIEKHLDYRKPQNILLVYNKAIENRVFLTPIGMQYLQSLQGKLLQCGIPKEKIQPVPLFNTYSNKSTHDRDARIDIRKRKSDAQIKNYFAVSFFLNILFALIIVGMFVISFRSDIPNILNYRTAIINEYAEWEQELSEREAAVREAERNLQINP